MRRLIDLYVIPFAIFIGICIIAYFLFTINFFKDIESVVLSLGGLSVSVMIFLWKKTSWVILPNGKSFKLETPSTFFSSAKEERPEKYIRRFYFNKSLKWNDILAFLFGLFLVFVSYKDSKLIAIFLALLISYFIYSYSKKLFSKKAQLIIAQDCFWHYQTGIINWRDIQKVSTKSIEKGEKGGEYLNIFLFPEEDDGIIEEYKDEFDDYPDFSIPIYELENYEKIISWVRKQINHYP